MDEQVGDPLNELAWLAFFAEQRGWSDLVDKIATNAAEFQQKNIDIEKRRRKQSQDGLSSDESAA